MKLSEKIMQQAASMAIDETLAAENDARYWQKIRKLEQERKTIAMNKIMGAAAIPERFSGKSFLDYVADSSRKMEVLAQCKLFAQGFESIEKSSSTLFMFGNIGTGKTHLACAIANHLIAQGKTALYVTTNNLVRRVRATWAKSSAMTEEQQIAAFTKPDLLVIDEVGASTGSDNEKQILFDVINTRYEAQKPFIIVSNLSIDGIKGYLGDRAFDRLKDGKTTGLLFDWESGRGKYLG
jgi:DNA replication protein DnaC